MPEALRDGGQPAVAIEGGVRDAITKVVRWEPARNSIKYGVHAMARARAKGLEARGTVPEIANVFTGSCPNSGSQWAKALFDHPVVRHHTGLLTLPQIAYWSRPLKAFPAGTFVPGMYVSYQQYEAMPKPFDHRMVYIFRDPRDIVVSAYGSMEPYPTVPDAPENRAEPEGKSMDEAILWLIGNGEGHLRDMATWVGAEERDQSVRTWRLEDIRSDYEEAVNGMLEHCNVSLSATEFEMVLAQTTRQALQRNDLAGRKAGGESHYRINRRSYRDVFKSEHYEALEKVVPGLIEQLGYPSSPY